MILLGVDTCGGTGTLSLGLVSAGEPLAVLAASELPGRSAAAMLVPAITQLLLDAQVSLQTLTGLVVVDGPGSFTGIRIGLSTVKALAEACELRVFPVSRLRVLADVHGATSAVLDAGRGEFFLGSYPLAGDPDQATGEWLLTTDEVAARFAGAAGAWPALVVCEPKAAAAFPGARIVVPPTAADALRAALPAVLAGVWADVSCLDGRYLWRSDLDRRTVPDAS